MPGFAGTPISNPISALAGTVNNAWSYVKNQCTYYAASVATWIPAGLGNAADWLHNAQLKGFKTTTTPTVGSVVVYGRGNGYDPANGHVALVSQVFGNGTFSVSEQNFDGRGTVQTGRISTMQDVQGFILNPTQSGLNFVAGAPGLPGGNLNLNPLDIPGAIGSAVTAIGGTITRALYMIVGLILFGFGMVLLLKAEGVKTPSVPLPGPAAAARVVGKASTPAPASAAPAVEGVA